MARPWPILHCGLEPSTRAIKHRQRDRSVGEDDPGADNQIWRPLQLHVPDRLDGPVKISAAARLT